MTAPVNEKVPGVERHVADAYARVMRNLLREYPLDAKAVDAYVSNLHAGIERQAETIRALRQGGGEAVAWQVRHIDPDEGPGTWQPCDAEHVALFRARGDRYEIRGLTPAASEEPTC